MRVDALALGMFATNCYVLSPEGSGECVVVDPGAESARVVAHIREKGFEVRYVLATHGHADHTGAIAAVKDALGGVFAAPEADRAILERPDAWMTAMLPDFGMPPSVDLALNDGDVLTFGGEELRVLATPGHTPGGVSFQFEGAVVAGDTLFQGSIGRTDLPGGDLEQELASIRDILLPLGDDVVVLPGHGPQTTVGRERETNPFLVESRFV